VILSHRDVLYLHVNEYSKKMSFLLFLSFQLQSQYIYYELFLQIIILKKSICNKYEPTNGGAISHGQRSF